jgi:hypothetical protein
LRSKSEAARILEVVKTTDPDKAAANLKFLAETGLIADAEIRKQIEVYLEKRKPGEGIVLPSGIPPLRPAEAARFVVCTFPPSVELSQVKKAVADALTAPPLSLQLTQELESGTAPGLTFRKSLGPSNILPGNLDFAFGSALFLNFGSGGSGRLSVLTDFRLSSLESPTQPSPDQQKLYSDAMHRQLSTYLLQSISSASCKVGLDS